MVISLLGADLGDLLGVAVQLLKGKRDADVHFQTEPGEHHWSMHTDGERLHLAIESWEELMTEADTWRREAFSFEADVGLIEFAGAVAHAAEELVTRRGVDVYEEKWMRPFPGATLSELEELLGKLR
jgi:hypothetical protein